MIKWKIAYLIYVLLITIMGIIVTIVFISAGNSGGSAILGIWTGAFYFVFCLMPLNLLTSNEKLVLCES